MFCVPLGKALCIIVKKPKYYKLRLFGPYLAIVPLMAVFTSLDTIEAKSIMLLVYFVVATLLSKKFNSKEIRKYYNYELALKKERLSKLKSEDVSENIRHYKEREREKRLNAKWWQFWV